MAQEVKKYIGNDLNVARDLIVQGQTSGISANGLANGYGTYNSSRDDFIVTPISGTNQITLSQTPFTVEAENIIGGQCYLLRDLTGSSGQEVIEIPLVNFEYLSNTLTLRDFDDTFLSTDTVVLKISGPLRGFDINQDVFKFIEQVRERDTADSWLGLGVFDAATNLSVTTHNEPIYWNSGHRDMDIEIKNLTGTGITVNAYVTGYADADINPSDPDNDADWTRANLRIFGTNMELSGGDGNIYNTVDKINPEMILIHVNVTDSTNTINVRYRKY